jgi:hypothetical protein
VSDRGPITVFLCGRPAPRVTCACGHVAHYACEFQLRGRAAGRYCARPLCADCGRENGKLLLCGAHDAIAKAAGR